MTAYGEAFEATSSDFAPWWIVPADHKWYRDWVILQLLVDTLEQMAPAYPDTSRA